METLNGPNQINDSMKSVYPIRMLTQSNSLSSINIIPYMMKKSLNQDCQSSTVNMTEKGDQSVQLQSKKRVRIRKKKDRKPWRAQTAYEIFCEQQRDKIKASMPDACSRDINRALGVTWANFSKLEKKQFSKEAKVDKKTTANNLKAIEEKMGRKLKKPVCAYSLFVKDYRKKIQE